MYFFRSHRYSLAMLAGSCLLSVAVHAEQHRIEEIEVLGQNLESQGLALSAENSTASRLGTPLQDIPASVSVINKESIAVKGDFSGMSAVTRAAGFSSSASPGNGGTAMSVRGFSGHGSVVSMYDGNRLFVGSGTVSFPADTWTIDRIEVLRGPGSVINGVGAIGATVNYIPKKPGFHAIENEVAVTTGSNNLQRYAFGSGGKITSALAYRLDIAHHSTDGYVDNNEEKRTAVSGSLLFRPHHDVDIQLSVDYAETDASAYFGTPLVNGKILKSTRKNNYNVDDGIVSYEDLWPRLNITWHINDNVQLRSNTNYLDSERHWRNIENYTYNPATQQVDRSSYLEIIHEQTQLSTRNDVLFTLDIGGIKNRLNVGFEVNKLEFTHINNSPYNGSSSVDLYNPVPGSWHSSIGLSETTHDFDTDTLQYALFLDNVVEFNEQWQLVTGFRRDVIDYERNDVARSNGQGAESADMTLYATSWRAGVVFKPVSSISLYAQHSKALDAIDSLLSTSAANTKRDLTEGTQSEIGIKHQLLNDQLQYTVSLYDISKTNLMSSDPGGIQRQIGEQISRGVELEVFWQALDVLSIELNAALARPEYKEFVSGSTDYTGKVPRGVPEKTANLWLSWQMVANWTIGGGLRYVGERYLDHGNTSALPDYTVFDATLQWQVIDNLRFSLRGKNLTNTNDYVLSGSASKWILSDGRTVELGLHFRF